MKLDFNEMSILKKIYWKLVLLHMDIHFVCCDSHWSLLKPSFIYTHTEKECREESLRIIAEVKSILNDIN